MHIGLFTVHPVTVPIGQEILHALVCTLNHSALLYSGVVRPELEQLKEVISLL